MGNAILLETLKFIVHCSFQYSQWMMTPVGKTLEFRDMAGLSSNFLHIGEDVNNPTPESAETTDQSSAEIHKVAVFRVVRDGAMGRGRGIYGDLTWISKDDREFQFAGGYLASDFVRIGNVTDTVSHRKPHVKQHRYDVGSRNDEKA